MAKNKVTFGLSQVHIALIKEGKYEKPVHVPGAVQFTPSTAGDQSSFAADNNGKYFSTETNAGYTAELTLATLPLEVLSQMLGYEIDDSGAMIETAGAKAVPFALMFQVEGDQCGIRNVFYHCTAGRPAQEYQTTGETTDIAGEQLSITIAPYDIKKDGKLTVKATLPETAENKEKYAAFFDGVYGVEALEG